jgi:hypothetical protein
MSDTPTETIQPDGDPSKKQSAFKQPWFLALMAVLLIAVVAGVITKTVNENQNAKIGAIQLQQKQDKAKAAAAVAEVKHDAAAAKQKAAAASKTKRDARALAKAQKDAADAKRLAQQAQKTPPKVTVVNPPAPAPVYVNSTPDYSSNSLGLPSGLLCKDVVAHGFGYSDAVSYWYSEGSPPRMDADNDGIPCETVYSSSDVISYWNGQGVYGGYLGN